MSRLQYIQKNFLDIQLTNETLDVYVPRRAILNAVKEITPLLNGHLLDIGCGQMPYREMMLAANTGIANYTGLDLENSDVHNTAVADLHWDGKQIPLTDGSIDCAMATEVLEHSFNPHATLLEINRVMKKGGVFFFTVPFLWPLHETPYDAFRYTPFSLRMFLEQAGFGQINIKSLGGWHTSFAQMLGLWAVESPLRGYRKKYARKIARRLIPFLLKRDVPQNDFRQHTMISGLYGTAIKI